MPLVRFPVRNEYGLGNPELYSETERDDPKSLLQGVAVAGLVGILRQLGDLAEFAAEVFHGLQEEVTITSSRSRKMMARVQSIEAALPQLEKSMLAQKSHLHFAYTTGSVWHTHPRIEQNHFINGDLPEFIMDSYEECSDPPRLHLLDKFDSGGPGSCLKRYSDPTYFKKASAVSGELNGRLSKSRKSYKSKKERAQQRIVSSRGPSVSSRTDRPQFAPIQAGVQISPSPSQTVSTYEDTIKSDQEEQPNDFVIRTDSSYIECVFHPTSPIKPEEHEAEQVSISSSQMLPDNSTYDLASVDEGTRDVDDGDFRHSPLQEQIIASSSSVSWEEKAELVDSIVLQDEPMEAAEILGTDFDGDAKEKGKPISDNVGEMQIRASSSSVSWEEKAELVGSIVLQDEPMEAAEILGTDFDGDAKEKGKLISDNVGEMEFSVENDGLFTSSQIRPDDVDSEPDDFMDALNTIESESETDTDIQTKRQVESSFSFNNGKAKDEIHEQMAHYSEDLSSNQTKQEVEHSCNTDIDRTRIGVDDEYVVENSDMQSLSLESLSVALGGSYDEPSFDNPVSSGFCAHEELPKSAEESCNMDISVNNSIVESVDTETLSNSSGAEKVNQQILVNTEVHNTSNESQAISKENSGVQPVQFWTNGGLLGLEPSKPPVWVAPNTVEGSVVNDKDVKKSSLAQSTVNGGHVEKPYELAQSSEIIERNSSKCSTSYRGDSSAKSDKKPSWRFLSAVIDAKRENSSYFQLGNSFNTNLANSFGRMNSIIPKNEHNISADGRALCGEASQGDMSNGSRISFPLNDFQRSLVNSQSLGYRSLGDKVLKGNNVINSPMHSPSSSPPLQHMKISFQPANDLGTSKLKLKFPDGSFSHESGTYMLPSFQLVPEPGLSHHETGSDSDDGTFCRSSPYMSDDRRGNESESDSEQWDSDDNPRSNDSEAYDGIHSMSLKESDSTSTGIDQNRHETTDVDYGFQSLYTEKLLEPAQVNASLDLPCLSAMNPLFEQEMRLLSDSNDTPQPPPLPLSEWRNIKPNSDVTNAKQESDYKQNDHENNLKLLDYTIASQSKPNQAKQQIFYSPIAPESYVNLVKQRIETNEAVTLLPKREPEERSSLKKEANQIRKGKVVDEKEDFLHQIKTQSFNLRRTGTMTEKPNLTTGLATNARVTAILEKANAIRQAVGSDDGDDDDNWSEA